MATINAFEMSLLDVTQRMDPDGKPAVIAEVLAQQQEVLEDITWKEGNLPTGERTVVRTSQPRGSYRRLNEGVPVTKSTVAAQDDGAAMLEDWVKVDRKVAILSQDIGKFRLDEAKVHMKGMADVFAETLFYGDASLNPKEFTGLTPRYDDPSGITGDNIINGGGTGGTNYRSIWLIGWDPQTISGLYPKGSKGGLFHTDVTSNTGNHADGYPLGDVLTDDSGNEYLGYRDHFGWDCGLTVKDWRYAVRIANLDLDTITKQASTTDLEDLMIQAVERIQGLNGVRAAFYMPREIRTLLRRQMVNNKSPFLSQDQYGGRRVTFFDEVPIRRVDALNIDEAAVSF